MITSRGLLNQGTVLGPQHRTLSSQRKVLPCGLALQCCSLDQTGLYRADCRCLLRTVNAMLTFHSGGGAAAGVRVASTCERSRRTRFSLDASLQICRWDICPSTRHELVKAGTLLQCSWVWPAHVHSTEEALVTIAPECFWKFDSIWRELTSVLPEGLRASAGARTWSLGYTRSWQCTERKSDVVHVPIDTNSDAICTGVRKVRGAVAAWLPDLVSQRCQAQGSRRQVITE